MRTFKRRTLEIICSSTLTFALCAPAWAAVHEGDQLDVTVYNHPELSRHVTVDASGDVSLPLAGTVMVRGLEPAQIAARVRSAIDPYVIAPAVDVQLAAQTASIFVSGPVGGVERYTPGETLVSLMSAFVAGGTAAGDGSTAASTSSSGRSRIDLRRVALQRDDKTLGTYDVSALAASGQAGPVLRPGDTISLVDKPIGVRVSGDVRRPGLAYLASDDPLSTAIDDVGGVDATAATSHVLLVRGGATSSLALGDAIFREPARDGDVVTVQTAPRVSVVGYVQKPGTTTLRNDFSLLSALYEAGGPAPRADLAHIAVIHAGAKKVYDIADLAKGDVAQNAVLADGDTVYVEKSRSVDFSGVFQSLLPFLFFVRR